MISLDLALKLKEVGLKWEPQLGDFFFMYHPVEQKYSNKPDVIGIGSCSMWPEDIWLPRLDQLLAEIERRGYGWEMFTSVDGVIVFFVLRKCEILGYKVIAYDVTDSIPENAAAKALLWILIQEKEMKGEVI